jgi:hypothetical protein
MEPTRKPAMTQKEFNATPAGQRALCDAGSRIGAALMLNRAIRDKGGIGWDPQMIETANEVLLIAIKENLREEWNALCEKAKLSQPK